MHQNKITNRKDFIFLICLAAIVFLVYFMSVQYSFMESFDDNAYVLNNRHLLLNISNISYWFTHACHGCYLPLTMISYMFDYTVWDLNSLGYHLQNTFWHIVSVIFIYRCFRFFKIESWLSFLLCLIFAVHPQRVESVVWISERKDVLCAAFYFASIYFYIIKAKKSFPALSLIFFILALISKPMAVSLPIILFIYEWYKIVVSSQWSVVRNKIIKQEKVASREWRAANPKSKVQNSKYRPANQHVSSFYKLIPFFIILILFVPVTFITQSNIGAIKSSTDILSVNRIFSVLYNYFWYFSQTLFPLDNTPIYYPHQISTYSVLEIVIFYLSIIILFIVLYIKNRKVFLFSILPLVFTYIVTLSPVIGILRIGPTDHADRYSYIPSVFIWFCIGLFINKLIFNKRQSNLQITQKKKIKLVFLLILVLYLITVIILNCNYQRFWSTQYTLFSYAASKPRPSPNILCPLGDIAITKNDYDKIFFVAEKLEKDTKNSSQSAFYQTYIIYKYNRKKAINLLLELYPFYKVESQNKRDYFLFYPRILRMLINSYSYTGNKKETVKYIDELLDYGKISKFEINNLKGMKAEYAENFNDAIFFYNNALKIDPNNSVIKKRLNRCKIKKEQ